MFFSREREHQLHKQQATVAYIDEFKKHREEWKIREEKLMQQENERIKQYQAVQQVREEQRQESKKAMDESREKAQNAVSSNWTCRHVSVS